MAFRAWALVLAFTGLLFAAPAEAAAPSFPPLTGRVVDDAHVLSPEVQAELTAKLQALEQKNGDQLVVVTLPSLQGLEVEDYGYQLGRAWGIGQKGRNNGALFIIAPTEHKVRIEVGYGLEPVLTDAMSSVILQSAVLPRFRTGDISGGIVAGTDAIIQQLGLDPQTAEANAKAAEARAARAEARAPSRAPRLPIIIVVIIVFLVIRFMLGGRGGGLWALPFLFMGGGGGGWGRRDDGGDGGGFSGGGGSFGGGGSSGSW
ncbi:MAG TPA: TPM domain-containing protein [Caulobacteraceae bacterium]|nr:TPM domain-containing protein [Caulobacteraceae bacterium]